MYGKLCAMADKWSIVNGKLESNVDSSRYRSKQNMLIVNDLERIVSTFCEGNVFPNKKIGIV